mmetsp:Transcript_31114/g.119718  ORF Transcript_31114/g.119718 Transcript_31114/m.119718 type:complete len:128 (-) Transcript_31114:535-918(-)
MASSVYPPQPSKAELRLMFYESAIRFGIFCVALRAAPYVRNLCSNIQSLALRAMLSEAVPPFFFFCSMAGFEFVPLFRADRGYGWKSGREVARKAGVEPERGKFPLTSETLVLLKAVGVLIGFEIVA